MSPDELVMIPLAEEPAVTRKRPRFKVLMELVNVRAWTMSYVPDEVAFGETPVAVPVRAYVLTPRLEPAVKANEFEALAPTSSEPVLQAGANVLLLLSEPETAMLVVAKVPLLLAVKLIVDEDPVKMRETAAVLVRLRPGVPLR